jgi:syntaxin 18
VFEPWSNSRRVCETVNSCMLQPLNCPLDRLELASSRTSKLLRLLPARLAPPVGSGALSSDFLAAHNASVTWYLNRRLAEVSQIQKEMQEERIKRQLERTRTLGSAVADPLRPPAPKLSRDSSSGLWPDSSTTSAIKPVIDAGASSDDSDDDDLELSQSQMQQFEEENAAILREAQDALATVQQAESRLMEISALQMELVSHLTQQAEITDQLYEDAIEAGATVSAGNKQLVEARRRQKDSRLFILVFLIGATMALLFLHNY